jgi:hypothetical protein
LKDLIPVVASQGAIQIRASEVKTKLLAIKDNTETGYLDQCDLLREAQEGKYAEVWGYATFTEWIEQASGLGMSARQAYYSIKISKTANALGLSRAQLKAVQISNMKVIFGLDVKQHEAAMRELMEEAPGLSLKEVTSKVQALKGEPESQFFSLKLEQAVYENVMAAFELVRKNHGSVDANGDPVDITDSKCLELICAEYMNDANNYEEDEA